MSFLEENSTIKFSLITIHEQINLDVLFGQINEGYFLIHISYALLTVIMYITLLTVFSASIKGLVLCALPGKFKVKNFSNKAVVTTIVLVVIFFILCYIEKMALAATYRGLCSDLGIPVEVNTFKNAMHTVNFKLEWRSPILILVICPIVLEIIRTIIAYPLQKEHDEKYKVKDEQPQEGEKEKKK